MAWRRRTPSASPRDDVARAAIEADRARSLTAATATVELGRESAWASWKFANREWQIEAWRLYDIIPELRFLAGWIGDSVSQCRLYVTRVDETGEETGEVDDRRIAEIGAQPLGSGSQRDDNLRLLGVDLAVSGEAWVVGEGAFTGEAEDWFVVSGSQIRRNGQEIAIRRPLSSGGKVLTLREGRDILMRAWRPHPNDIWQSDSPTRSAIPALREIELLTKREFAELESRLVGAGVWMLPEGVDFPRGEGDPEGMTGAMAMLQRAAAENIREQSRASSMVPIIATIPDNLLEHLDKFKEPSRFWSELSEHILPMKEKAIVRVAASFEIPSEILTGLGDSNHWSAWAVSEEGIKRCRPYLSTIADTLTRGFLVPALESAGIEDPDKYAYAFDVSPLSVRPNRLPEALELWDRFLITDDEAVRAGAFSEEVIPSDQERVKSLLFRSVVKDPSLLADPGFRAALGIREAITIGVPAPGIEEVPARETPDNSPPREPESDPVGETPPGVTASFGQLQELLNADHSDRMAELAIRLSAERALEIAGGRLASHADRRRWLNTPRHQLHTRVGPVSLERAQRALAGIESCTRTAAEELGVDNEAMRVALQDVLEALLVRGTAFTSEMVGPIARRLKRGVR